MDPWANCQSRVTIAESTAPAKFEDNFIPELDKLPDHAQYLAVLESKLSKIKSDPNVLRQLSAKRESYMQQFLSEEPTCSFIQLSLEEPVSDSPLLRTILPQKQALNQGELVEFIKYDQLVEEEEDSDKAAITNRLNKAQENLENHTDSS